MTPYCSACGEPFQSQGLFDQHRVGKHHPTQRRCLTPDEMVERGWRHDGRTWRGPAGGNPFTKASTPEDFFMQEAEPLESTEVAT